MLIALLVAIFLLSLYQVKFNLKGFHVDYLSKSKTDSVKGIFILLIVLTHSLQYILKSDYAFNGLGDSYYESCLFHLGQLVVVMFLFYSGYGVSESFKKKGMAYVKAMPRHRLLTTLLNFDVAVIAFIAVDLLLGIAVTPGKCLLSLTGWQSVGNSNWYIFVILLCYLMTFVVLRLSLSKRAHQAIVLFAISFALVLLLYCFKDSYWYDTLLCYPLGFVYSAYKDPIESFLKRHYWVALSAVGALFVVTYLCPNDAMSLRFNLTSMLFALAVVMVTMKVGIGNAPLSWLGKNLFPIYIYMRVPMLVLEHECPGMIASYPALFIVTSLLVTLLIAKCYKYWQIKL